MSTLVYPAHSIVAGSKAKSADVLALFNAITTWANGNIDDTNVKAAAAIAQSKIANLTTDLAAKVAKAGDQMTGRLRLKLAAGDEFGLVVSGTNLLIEENTGTEAVPVWVTRVAVPVGGVFGVPTQVTTVAASSEGTSNNPARANHVHGLKTAVGVSTGSTDNTDITLNDFSFFPSYTNNGGTMRELKTKDIADPSNTIAALRVGAGSGTWTVRWKYITASRPPELVVLRNKATLEPVAIWQSEIDYPSRAPVGLAAPRGFEAVQVLGSLPKPYAGRALDAVFAGLQKRKLCLEVATTDRRAWVQEARKSGVVVFRRAKVAKV